MTNKYEWDLSKLYNSLSMLQKDVKKVNKLFKISKIYNMKGLSNSGNLIEFLEVKFEVDRIIDKIVMYCFIKYNKDMQSNHRWYFRIMRRIVALKEKIDKIDFVLYKIDNVTIKKFSKESSELSKYRLFFKRILLEKNDKSKKIFNSFVISEKNKINGFVIRFKKIYNFDSDLNYIINIDNHEIFISPSSYLNYLFLNSRSIRRKIYNNFHQKLASNQKLYSVFIDNIHHNNLLAKSLGYNSVYQMELKNEELRTSIYETFIEQISNNIKLLQRYLNLRKKILKLKTLCYFDLYNVIGNELKKNYTFEEAKSIVTGSLALFGRKYVACVNKIFDSNLIDVYCNKDKVKESYSVICYDSDPYIMLNYKSTIDDLFILTHEIGHSVHGYFSNENLYVYSKKNVFISEVAAMVNELVLNKYMYDSATSKKEKMGFLYNLLNNYSYTLFKQSMLSEFENELYKKSDESVFSKDDLCQKYKKKLHKYYGDIVQIDEYIINEWLVEPHFYSKCYFFKYALSFTVAVNIFNNMVRDKNYIGKYLSMLKKGSSKQPVELLKSIQVDITKTDFVVDAMREFEKNIEKLECDIKKN